MWLVAVTNPTSKAKPLLKFDNSSFLLTAVPEGSSVNNNRSVETGVVSSASAVILISAILLYVYLCC